MREVTFSDCDALGKAMDRALAAMAEGDLCRDEATLALLTLVESAFYTLRIVETGALREIKSYDALVCPALDYIVSQYPDDRSATSIGPAAIELARPWLRASHEYHGLVTGPINHAKKQMDGVVVDGGRLVFFPPTSYETELRNRWFENRWHHARRARGEDILVRDQATIETIKRIERHIGENLEDLRNGFYRPPQAPWYEEHCNGIVDRTLVRQFADVQSHEVWGGLTKTEVMACVKPLLIRAARKVLAHLRAYYCLIKNIGTKDPVLFSVVDTVSRDTLLAEMATSSAVAPKRVAPFLDDLVRKGREERYGILSYPLVPLSNGRLTYLPSVLLFANWPQARERGVAKRSGGNFKDGKQRVKRHMSVLETAARSAGFAHVATNVPLKDPSKSEDVTDLDVVVVSADVQRVLVLQLKSFLTPSDLLSVEHATRETRIAVKQCRAADEHLVLVKDAVESRVGLRLASGWVLRQIIVVEGITGTDDTPADYPAVSLEWIEDRFRSATGQSTGHIDSIWNDARTLPDAGAFRQSVVPLFELYDGMSRTFDTGQRVAVFAYLTDPDQVG